jgi:retron-type reverse transcriptase
MFLGFLRIGQAMQLYQFLCSELSASKQEISQFALSAPKKYKVYTIPKRTSGKRTIAHPAKKLKEYQRALTILLEQFLPVHNAAFAYRKNIGIKQNAKQHLKSKYLLKMDFKNFFHSIHPDLFFSIIEKQEIDLTKEDYYLLAQLLFWCPSKRSGGKLILSVGAPSSPFISNAIMFFFDQDLSKICKEECIAYTRYADDITFSTNIKNKLFDVPDLVKKLLFEHFDGFITINESKTVFSSKSHNRHVTGVTLSNDGNLSIGRQRKRYISSLIHKLSINQLPAEDAYYLQGLFAFACNIEPTFKHRMIKKYSSELINQIVTGVKVKK